jgi:hypothetical protein
MILELFGIIILLFIAVVLLRQFFCVICSGYAPFIPTKKEIIEEIINKAEFKDGSVVYELGCGHAGFLRLVEKKFPKIEKLVGVEYFLSPFLIAGIQLALHKSKIKLLKKNLFDVDLKEADIIYCFLNKPTMEKLKEKFLRECKPGTQIISYQFTLPDMAPEKIVDVNNDEKHKIYFYKI